jgi:GNAT superfamily N-acetyltransferase
LSKRVVVRRGLTTDALSIDVLLYEWLGFRPSLGRLDSIRRAVLNAELLIAEADSIVIGFIHYVMHEDVIDGDPNSFITAFYVTEPYRHKRIGTDLLKYAIDDSIAKGAVGVETSTIHSKAKKLYEKLHFKQTFGDVGEVFLELDVEEYRRANPLPRISLDRLDRDMNQLE